MKLKSLLLGSVAAVGLSTTAFAADLSTVVSSFDVCEDLGISGTLQLASTDDCLQISGEVTYEFSWGDFKGTQALTTGTNFKRLTNRNVDDNDSQAAVPGQQGTWQEYNDATGAPTAATGSGYVIPAAAAGFTRKWIVEPVPAIAADPNKNMDWENDLDWWLQFVGSASSEFGTAKAVIKLSDKGDEIDTQNETVLSKNEAINDVQLDEAYVSVGDGTTLVAGKRDTSVFKEDDDTPFGFIGLFNSDEVDAGVDVLGEDALLGKLDIKGRVIQVYHAVGDSGVTLSGGLENLDGAAPASAGTAIGTIAYAAPDGSLVGHASFAGGGFLDGTIDDWKTHFGATATMDNFKVRGAFAYGSSTNAGVTTTGWNGLATAEATFDIFTLAAAIEGGDRSDDNPVWGASVTGSAAVTDQVTVAAGFRYFDSDTTVGSTETWQAALKLIAKLTDTLTGTLEGGVYDTNIVGGANNVLYGSAQVEWAPGGQFTTSLKGEVNSIGAYKATFKASKKFD